MPDHDSHAKNRSSWNAATRQHNSHKGDQVAFLRNSGTTLFPEEVALLGDVRGKKLVHLQCNSGQDTLSIAQHLEATVTGVDISDEAIDFARKLSTDSGIPGEFIRADVYDWFAQNTVRYDVVFSSYGAIPWLSDLAAWGKGIAAALVPGGRFVLVEFHPVMGMLDDDDASRIKYDYGGGKRYEFEDGIGDYVAMSGTGLIHDGGTIEQTDYWTNPHPSVEFAWGLGDIVTALTGAGLHLIDLQEYFYSNGFKPFPQMLERDGRRMVMPPGSPQIPLMFGLIAQQPDA